jgi:murein DD-endopeptidase MepM/ murein hydrolase activator NlpD|tara:strand:- start:2243 stop:2815 length:573 start_codon:yes stop_codon:yes gene_type:complete
VQARLNNLAFSLLLIFTTYGCETEKVEKTNPLESKVDSLQNVIYCQEEELQRIRGIIDSLPLGPPLDTLIVSSKYGWRKRPLGGGWQMHSGVDYMATWFDTVYATGYGVVVKSGWNLGYGRQVRVEHLKGYESSYSHLHKLFVKKGDSIKKGQPLGRAGNSGVVTGAHLHYEVIRNNIKTNPIPYIRIQK